MILCVCTGQFSIVALILTLLLQVCGAFIETIIFYFRGKGNSLREVEWRILKPAGWWILSATFSLFYDWGRGWGLDTWGFRSSGVTPKGQSGFVTAIWVPGCPMEHTASLHSRIHGSHWDGDTSSLRSPSCLLADQSMLRQGNLTHGWSSECQRNHRILLLREDGQKQGGV